MLQFLRGKYNERRYRLFACACCRRIWGWMADERSRQAITVCEDFADGRVGNKKLKAARQAALDASWSRDTTAVNRAAMAALLACDRRCLQVAEWTPEYASNLLRQEQGDYAERIERITQCDLLRDIFGNPLQPTPTIAPSVLTWNERTVVLLAQAIYEDRILPDGTLDKTRLAILADALEEAGCTNEEILAHCRSRSDHVRGCWVIDLLLGRA
jgi:hypothetical protein